MPCSRPDGGPVDMKRAKPPASWLAQLLLLAVLVVSLSGLSPTAVVFGFHVQVLEAIELVVLAWLVAVLPWIWQAGPTKGMVGLLLLNAIPLGIGIYTHGVTPALRDFAGVFYMLMVIFGYALGRYAVVGSVQLLAGLIFAGLIFAVFRFARWAPQLIDYDLLEFNFRIPALATIAAAALAAVGLSRLAGWRRWLVLGGGAFYFVYLLQLRTRAAYLGILVIAVIVLLQGASAALFDSRQRGRVLVSIAGIAMALLIIALSNPDRVAEVFRNAEERTAFIQEGYFEADETVAFRLDAWHLAWDEFLDAPIAGVGFGKYMLLDPWLRNEPEMMPSHLMHNGVLQILYAAGLLGLAGAIYFWIRVAWPLGRLPRRKGVIPVLGLAAGFMVYTAFGAILFKAVEAVLLWTLVGLAIGEAERFRRDEVGQDFPRHVPQASRMTMTER